MKKSFNKVMSRMVEMTKNYEGKTQQPASKEEIDQLQKKSMSTLKSELPQEYIETLEQVNGYSGFGIMLFATHSLTDLNGSFIEGVIEYNLDYFQMYPEIIALASCGDDLLVYDSKTKNFKNIDKIANNFNEEFSTFQALLDNTISSLIETETK